MIALGTNSTATTAMVRAGAQRGATGVNAIRVTLKQMDCVLGPMGLIVPDAMMGEITPEIAHVIVSSESRKILLPVHQQHVEILGVENRPLNTLIKDAVQRIKQLLNE